MSVERGLTVPIQFCPSSDLLKPFPQTAAHIKEPIVFTHSWSLRQLAADVLHSSISEAKICVCLDTKQLFNEHGLSFQSKKGVVRSMWCISFGKTDKITRLHVSVG